MRALFFAILFVPSLAFAQGQWIADSGTGCKVWNPLPAPNETISWSGPCANGFANGSGVLQWFESGKRADRYEGEYRDGYMHGRGVYTWVADGDRYDGEWAKGKPHGSGTLKQTNGDVYSGQWSNGCFKQGDRWSALFATKQECGFTD